MVRHPNDFYQTLPRELEFLLANIELSSRDTILEPCAGMGAISNPLREVGYRVVTNDIAPGHEHSIDLMSPGAWDSFGHVDWTIMNPPFSLAVPMVKEAFGVSRKGLVSYLRLSFLEPCANRVDFLMEHPVNKLLVMPRSSYKASGQSDTVTRAWFVWDKTGSYDRIRFLPPVRRARARG